MKTRGVVAMNGIFGFELDSTKMSREEKELCREQSEFYRKHYWLIANGDYYRLTNPFENKEYTAWQHVSKDKTESLASLVLTDKESNAPQLYLKLKGLNDSDFYRIQGDDRIYSGKALMTAGIPVPNLAQYESVQYYLTKVKEA